MSERLGFLRAIRSAPEDDTPRLVFADWLDDHGEHDRAELVRVQCELARLWHSATCPKCRVALSPLKKDHFPALLAGCLRCGCQSGLWTDAVKAARKECDLNSRAAALMPVVTAVWTPRDVGLEYRRGIVTRIVCPAAAWLAHGDDLYARELPWKVVLTTVPSVAVQSGLVHRRVRFWFPGRGPKGYVVEIPEDDIARNPQLTADIQTGINAEPGRRLLAANWPGIDFALPC